MIYPLNFTAQTAKTSLKDSSSARSENEKPYKDPLANQWLNCVTFSTELGAIVHEISPKTAQALWVPTILYLGADIYDKYKNDENKFSPSGKRGVEQAIYQALGGFVLPAASVYIGQQLTSPIGKLLNKGLSVNAKEQTLTHIRSALEQCVGNRFKNYENFEKFVLNSLENKIQACKNEKQTDGFLKKIIKYSQKKYALAGKNTDKIREFAKLNIRTLYDIKQIIERGDRPDKISKRIFHKYIDESSALKATYGKDYANDALRYALKSYQNKLIIENKLIKTFGGIVALALSAKPIYNYVQKTFIPKFVEPGLDRFNKALLDSSILKKHICDI